MATLLLQAAGTALGGLFGPFGAVIGRAAGALAGNFIDRSLISGMTTIEGRPLSNARIPGAEEGTGINRAYGTVRIGGTLIWATRFEEEVTVERSGGKATGPRIETFSYFANFAVGICEGPIAGIRRIWADGREIDQTTVELRLYRGTEGQAPDPLIEAKQGTGNAPAYRGLAYVVFERLPLDIYGNRIGLTSGEAGLPLNWIAEAYGVAGGRIGPMAFSGGIRAETPIAPVNLTAERTEAGDILLGWVRRSRLDADNRSGADVPWDEAGEGYRVEILDGETAVRTFVVSEPSCLYPAAAELADFGAPQDAISFRVRQKGMKVALGIAARASVVL